VRQCAENVSAGALNPVALIGLQHLIVDEYQDLNPVDQRFVEQLIAGGVIAFVAGDDDQSIYSFRYASPAGIQTFTQRYVSAGSHTLLRPTHGDTCRLQHPGAIQQELGPHLRPQ
jgi:DNA helicase II / ATP-dependent DNA helicase PcrA